MRSAKGWPFSPSVTKYPGIGRTRFDFASPAAPPNCRMSHAKLSTCHAAVSSSTTGLRAKGQMVRPAGRALSDRGAYCASRFATETASSSRSTRTERPRGAYHGSGWFDRAGLWCAGGPFVQSKQPGLRAAKYEATSEPTAISVRPSHESMQRAACAHVERQRGSLTAPFLHS
jgi:hypothetical protein